MKALAAFVDASVSLLVDVEGVPVSETSSTCPPIEEEFPNPTSRNSKDRIVSYGKRA